MPTSKSKAENAKEVEAKEKSTKTTKTKKTTSKKTDKKDSKKTTTTKSKTTKKEAQASKEEKPTKISKSKTADKSAQVSIDDPVIEEEKPKKNSEANGTKSRRKPVTVGSKKTASDKKNEKSTSSAESATSNNSSDSSSKATKAKEKSNNDKQDKKSKEPKPSETLDSLQEWTMAELLEKANELEIPEKNTDGLKKDELIKVVFKAIAEDEGFKKVHGILDIMQDGYGFLRCKDYMPSEIDVYVSVAMVRKNGLRKGDELDGVTRPPREGEKYSALNEIKTVNGIEPEKLGRRPRFKDLTPIFPDERLKMEHGKNTITARVIDLVAPIGKGQRGLIVSPPKAGKTTILKDIAHAISANNPEVHLMCLLVDERPEEVTDMERSIDGEVIASTFDMPCESHTAIAELTIERAKRLVECGRDVVILLDSITRLARAYNLAQPPSGRVLSGGVDSSALYPPKRFLGAARNIEHGGSLTILGSALIETGSKMDEVIFEEFKGTGNMELKLDRYLADRRIFPAIDTIISGTRKEDLLLDPQEAPLIWAVRRILANLNNTERATDMLIKSLKKTETNRDFLILTAKKASKSSTIDNIKGI